MKQQVFHVRLVQYVGEKVHVVWDAGQITAKDAAAAELAARERQVNQAISGDLIEGGTVPDWDVKRIGSWR